MKKPSSLMILDRIASLKTYLSNAGTPILQLKVLREDLDYRNKSTLASISLSNLAEQI